MNVTDLIRWACVVPAAIAGWYLALISGMSLLLQLNAWCPYGESISGACQAPWFAYADKTMTAVFAGLSAILVVLMASWVAPTKKALVAVVAYSCGAIAAVAMAVGLGAWAELASALGAGLFMVFLVYRSQGAQTNA